jgi:hypothetical protein
VASALRSLLSFDAIVCVDPALLFRAIEVYEVDHLDFAEAYLVACAESTGVGAVASFDRSLDRITAIERIERPRDRATEQVSGCLAHLVAGEHFVFGGRADSPQLGDASEGGCPSAGQPALHGLAHLFRTHAASMGRDAHRIRKKESRSRRRSRLRESQMAAHAG